MMETGDQSQEMEMKSTSIDVMALIKNFWNNRTKPSEIRHHISIFSNFMDQKDVFRDVEFFLPQLCNVVIHVDSNECFDMLIQLIVLIAQSSMHLALRMSCIIAGLLEDYQPEVSQNGKRNGLADGLLFGRCAHLMSCIEKAVAFSSPEIMDSEEMGMLSTSMDNSPSGSSPGGGRTRVISTPIDIPQVKKILEISLGRIFSQWKMRCGRPPLLVERAGSRTEEQKDDIDQGLGAFRFDRDFLGMCLGGDGDAEGVGSAEHGEKMSRNMSSEMLESEKTGQATRDARMSRRISFAECLARSNDRQEESSFSGWILYKRTDLKSGWFSQRWKRLFFLLEKQILMCFNTDKIATLHPRRCIPLQFCSIRPVVHSKYGDTCFEVVNMLNNSRFMMRAKDEAERQTWMEMLTRETNRVPMPEETREVMTLMRQSSGDDWDVESPNMSNPGEMNALQRKRLLYFRQMRSFIASLTSTCDKLRLTDASMRNEQMEKFVTDLNVPPFAYDLLCRSSDVFRCLIRPVITESFAFQTKERCPTMVMFEYEEHPKKSDVMSFFANELDQYSENDIKMKVKPTTVAEELAMENQHEEGKSRFDISTGSGVSLPMWSPAGSGNIRLSMIGIDLPASLIHQNSGRGLDLPMDESTPHATTTLVGEAICEKEDRLRTVSSFGALPGWGMCGIMAKTFQDMRQEAFVLQIIAYFNKAFQDAGLSLWLHPYEILPTAQNCGLVEFIHDAMTLDDIKKSNDWPGTLRKWYELAFSGSVADSDVDGSPLHSALGCFVHSMAAYSVMSYLLMVKDRHNANIMIDRYGHIIHIDFNYAFGEAPGRGLKVERAPWKLNDEFMEVMGGPDSLWFARYKDLCVQALRVAREHRPTIEKMIEIMQATTHFTMFKNDTSLVEHFRERLCIEQDDGELSEVVDKLITKSKNSPGTKIYDAFQKLTNNIAA